LTPWHQTSIEQTPPFGTKMLDQYGKLQIAVLVYFVLALPVAIYVCTRQGFGRHAGWLYLLTFALVRIIGAILRIVFDFKPSEGLYIAALVFASIGLIPLLLCFMAAVKRVFVFPLSSL
jgi:hypothetical protein